MYAIRSYYDQNFLDGAPVLMLDRLFIGHYRDFAGRHHALVEGGQKSPGQKTAKTENLTKLV